MFLSCGWLIFWASRFSACWLSCFRLCEIEVTVFLALPEFVALMRVFIMRFSHNVGCWGRRLASVSMVKSLCILAVGHLEWFRIPAWGVGDPGFKSQRPHQLQFCRILLK